MTSENPAAMTTATIFLFEVLGAFIVAALIICAAIRAWRDRGIAEYNAQARTNDPARAIPDRERPGQ